MQHLIPYLNIIRGISRTTTRSIISIRPQPRRRKGWPIKIHSRPFSAPSKTPSQPQPLPQQQQRQQQKQTIIHHSYAPSPHENPQCFARTHHNLPDELVTPLAETPGESYSVLNDFVQHPIRYRAWNGVLDQKNRPQSTYSNNNDYIPQRQQFDTTKQFAANKEEADHLDKVVTALQTGNLRELMFALHQSPPEYAIGFGLMISSVLLYSKYSSGFIGSFNYDAWVDLQFQQILVKIDERFQVGKRVEKLEQSWDDFEEKHSQLANLPLSKQSFTTRFYIWSRDSLFPDNILEASRWKQRRHSINDAYVIPLDNHEHLDAPKNPNQVDNPFIKGKSSSSSTSHSLREKLAQTDPRMARVLERENQRDGALIAIEQMRVQMIEDNRGSPLNTTQEYILRQRLRQVATDFRDLTDGLLDEYTGMDDLQFEEFQARRDRMEKQMSERSSLDHQQQQQKEQKERELGESQLDLLSSYGRDKYLSLEQQEQQQHATDGPTIKTKNQSKFSLNDALKKNAHAYRQRQQFEEEQEQQTQQGFFARVGSWVLGVDNSSTKAVDPTVARGEELYNTYFEKGVKYEGHTTNTNTDEARMMMEKLDTMPRYNTNTTTNNNTTTTTNNNDNMEQYRTGIYGEIAQPRNRGINSESSRSQKKPMPGFATEQMESDARKESWERLGLGSDKSKQQNSSFTSSFADVTKNVIDNPFSWLSKRDSASTGELIDRGIAATIEYRAQSQELIERNQKADFIAQQQRHDNINHPTGDSSSPLDPYQDPNFIKQRSDDDRHTSRLKGGLFGNLFGGAK